MVARFSLPLLCSFALRPLTERREESKGTTDALNFNTSNARPADKRA